MDPFTKLYFDGRPLDLPNPFEMDVQFLVKETYDLLCESIARKEVEEIADAENIEDPSHAGAERAWVISNADELRQEARSVAVVTLVTRFQHWLRVFVKKLTAKEPPNGVEPNLKILTKQFGNGPVPAEFFHELETVRDSIIHADSNVEWMRGNEQRSISLKYREINLEHLLKYNLTKEQLQEIREQAIKQINLTDEHVQEAMAKSMQQIKWYGDRLSELKIAKNSS